ncbi:MAG TPA: rod shape-determining protein MreC [Planctomicrobium sp.]|nr:rod shape-determining protein MreC [Planctomicrobium sp.]
MNDHVYHRSSYAVFIWAGCLVVAVLLNVGPRGLSEQIQNGLQGMVGWTLSVLPAPVLDSDVESADGNGDRAKTLAVLQAENRELRRQVAELRLQQNEWERHQKLPFPSGDELVQTTSVVTRILGRKGDPVSSNLQLLIALGKSHGLHESELVLTGDGLLLDGGNEQQIHPDQLMTAGRSLLGRTTRVGKQTSLVQPLTDGSFRMAVRIYRRSPFGPVTGPAGILAGTGTECRIDDVSATEAVAIGDDVYTDPMASPVGVPIYCGRITQVDVAPTATHWTIELSPENPASRIPREVHVLKSSLNPARISQPELP